MLVFNKLPENGCTTAQHVNHMYLLRDRKQLVLFDEEVVKF